MCKAFPFIKLSAGDFRWSLAFSIKIERAGSDRPRGHGAQRCCARTLGRVALGDDGTAEILVQAEILRCAQDDRFGCSLASKRSENKNAGKGAGTTEDAIFYEGIIPHAFSERTDWSRVNAGRGEPCPYKGNSDGTVVGARKLGEVGTLFGLELFDGFEDGVADDG